MKNILLLCWALGLGGPCGELAAQGRAVGPWRVTRQLIRYKPAGNWSGEEEWDAKPLPTSKAGTTTAVRVQRKLHRVPWNVHPDSITLFLDCQNPLLAPAASHSLAPVRFKATGATVRLDTKQQLLLLVPSASVVVLWAYRGQQVLFRHEFKAVPPPAPTVKCYTGSCITICKPSNYKSHAQTITLRVLPAADFAQLLPDDARYRVAQFRATLLRQGKPVELAAAKPAEQTVSGPQGDMSDLISTSQPGDQLQVDVLLVQRQGASGSITKVPVTQRLIINDLKCPN